MFCNWYIFNCATINPTQKRPKQQQNRNNYFHCHSNFLQAHFRNNGVFEKIHYFSNVTLTSSHVKKCAVPLLLSWLYFLTFFFWMRTYFRLKTTDPVPLIRLLQALRRFCPYSDLHLSLFIKLTRVVTILEIRSLLNKLQ